MCWIIITPNKDEIKNHLKYQEDRWLDSIWIINKENIHRAVKANIEWYNSYIDNIDNIDNSLYLIHHRKATVWDINLDNCHPFMGKNFILIQNGTVKDFHKETGFDMEVDSHNLLLYIEKHTKSIKNIPNVLKGFKEKYKEDFGILILADYKWNIIFISDWWRESYIEIEDNKIQLIRNYKRLIKEWYKNIWYIIFDFQWNLIKQEFEKELNTEDFKKKIIYNTQYNTRNDDCILWVKRKEKEEKELREWWIDLMEIDDDIKWEIKSYLWENYEILSFYSVDIMIDDFLTNTYWVQNTAWYYMIYKEAFPKKYFEEKFEEIKKESEDLLFNKK